MDPTFNDSDIESLNQFLLSCELQEGNNPRYINGGGIFKASMPHSKQPMFYEPLICLVAQGEKLCHVGDETFNYKKGDFFINMLPMPVKAEIAVASEETPFLSATLSIDLVRVADMLLRIEKLEGERAPTTNQTNSCLMVGKACDQLVTAFHRLVALGANEMDSAVLGESIVNEIYYRILMSEYGFSLRTLLSQYGQVQPISKAVSFIHNNLDKNIQIQELASLSNMSKTTFFNTFKKLMHVAPNQYIKSSKLQKAQSLLKNGMQANEASFRVGYNSFSQFSREYKRLFGFSPSETRLHPN